MIEKLNKQRKKATSLSLVVILIVVLLAIVSALLSKIHFLFTLFGILLLIICLYLFSKYIIIPKYDDIKGQMIVNSLKLNKNLRCLRIKSFVSPINILFDVVDMSYTNPFRFIKDNINLDVEDFVITKKERKKVAVRSFHGKIMQVNLTNYFSKDILAILDNNQDTKIFMTKANEHFKNAKLVSQMTPNGKYLTNTTNKDDLRKIGLLFDNIEMFNILLYKNNILTLMIKQKEEPFEFNLQNEIDFNTLDKAKKCYCDVDKILSVIKGENFYG